MDEENGAVDEAGIAEPRQDKPWLWHKGDKRARQAQKISKGPAGKSNFQQALSFKESLQRALAKRSRFERKQMLDQIAEKLIDRAIEGNLEAIKEVADRLDGKATQQTNVSGTVNHVQVFLRDAGDLERAMVEANKHRFIAPPDESVVDSQ